MEVGELTLFGSKHKKDGLDGAKNLDTAIKHCSVYLEQQLYFFQPQMIISLGNRVSSFFNIRKPVHGNMYLWKDFKVLHSTFPSRNTADHWVKNKEWSIIINRLNDELLKKIMNIRYLLNPFIQASFIF